MASGSYAKKVIAQDPAQTLIPPRATRQLPAVKNAEERQTSKALPIVRPPKWLMSLRNILSPDIIPGYVHS